MTLPGFTNLTRQLLRVAVLVLVLSPSQSWAQGDTMFKEPPVGDQHVTEVSQGFLTSREIKLSILVLAFGVVVLLCEYLLLRAKPTSPVAVLRLFGITLILVGTLFALTAGFSSEQIAPAMGLFGTIAGYLLGRGTPPSAKETT